MNQKEYWKLFKGQLQDALNKDSSLATYFLPLGEGVKSDFWNNLTIDAPFKISFSIADSEPRLDLYFWRSIYNLKKSRDAFVNKYRENYNDNSLEPGDDQGKKPNSDCRCWFKMGKTITDDLTGYKEGIDWQIKKLQEVYKNVFELNEEMLKNNDYVKSDPNESVESDPIAALLDEYKGWLQRKYPKDTSRAQYFGYIKRNGEKVAKYIGRGSIVDLSKADCDKISKEIDDVPDIEKNNSGGTYIKKFGAFLEDRKNKGTSEGHTMRAKTQSEKIYEVLDNNLQVILTGAPGTGKTFTVKKYVIEKTRESEPGTSWKFVQFHPSYDYSDFVEGLKPVPDTSGARNIFVRIDGHFKAFCRKIVSDALKEIQDSGVAANDKDALEEYKRGYQKKDGRDSESQECDQKEAEKEYYFFIDEINRADLSKVFGEIMYCLDEDYRGPHNGIQTQYSTLKTYYNDGTGTFVQYPFDCFEKGFFIPKNLHIIGTMNDIDRSVESFDFALRRRFLWKEIDANGSLEELGEIVKDHLTGADLSVAELINRAKEINDLLDPTTKEKGDKYSRLGLNKQYQLGKAYYKKFDGSEASLKEIYDGKIEPIIKEYTRGRNQETVGNLLEEINRILLSPNATPSEKTATDAETALPTESAVEETSAAVETPAVPETPNSTVTVESKEEVTTTNGDIVNE